MKKELIYSCLFIVILTLGCFAQNITESSPTQKSFRKALTLTQNALKTHRGDNEFESSDGVQFTAEGKYDLLPRRQSFKSDVPNLVSIKETFGYSPKTGAVLFESNTYVNPGTNEWMRFLYDGEGRMLIVHHLDKWAIWATNPDVENQRQRYSRIIPQVLLKEALKYRQTLRYQGVSKIGNEEFETVSFSLPTNETLTLFFSKQNNLLRATEHLIDHPLSGDTTVRWVFNDYKPVKNLGKFPFAYEIFLGNKRLKSVRIKEIQPKFEMSEWTKSTKEISIPKPPELKPKQATTNQAPPKKRPPLTKIVDGVYLATNIRGGFHPLIVEFEDFMMVVDTPAGYHELQQIPATDWAGETHSSAVGERLLKIIKDEFPNKPVKYAVLTHHHADHIGGIQPFMNAGAKIIASEETIKAVKKSMQNKFSLNKMQYPKTLNYVLVEKEKEISDDKMKVNIINVDKNPHAEGMLVVYLPKQKILYQSDLFEPFRKTPSNSRLPTMKWFVKWLDNSGLKPERFFAIHGSAVVEKEQIEKVRKLNESQK